MRSVYQEVGEAVKALGPEHTGATANLAARMQIFDHTKEELEVLAAGRADLEGPLLERSLDDLLAETPDSLAYNALCLYVLNKKTQLIQQRLSQIRLLTNFASPVELVGQKVRVTSLDANHYLIYRSRKNRDGQLTGLSKYYESREGIVTKVNLSPEFGGWLQFAGRFSRIYSTGALIDRQRDYQPCYDIKKI